MDRVFFIQEIKNCVDDCMYLYKLQLLPNIRDYSLTRSIPTWDEHYNWFQQQIKNDQHCIYRIINDQQSVGMISCNQKEIGKAVISIIIDPMYSGNGFAKLAIKKLANIYNSLDLEAVIHRDNIASIKAFEANGFMKSQHYSDSFELYLREKK